MWTKERTKIELAGDLVEEMMPLLKGRQVLLFFDSWYAKSSLMERVLQYPELAIVCNARSDSAMYELPPLPNGKPGRPKKRGKRIHPDDYTLNLSILHMSCNWQKQKILRSAPVKRHGI